MIRCAKHLDDCPFTAAAQQAFDRWMEAQKAHARGEIDRYALRDAQVAYSEARDERLEQCDGVRGEVGA